jgi:hypothetical protein
MFFLGGKIVASISFANLQTVVRDPASATRNVRNSNRCYPEYNILVSNYMVKHNSFLEKESALHIISMENWIKRKEITTSATTPNYGEIWFTDLGSNYKPECSYTHPTVIIEVIGNMVLVVPSTTSPQLIRDAYHPTDNPTGNKFFRKVGAAEGFANTCVLILSNIRAISKGRLLDLKGAMPGVNDPTKSSVFWEIKDLCFEFAFPKKHIEIYKLTQANEQLEEDKNNLKADKDQLEKERNTLQREKDTLEKQNEDLQKKIDELKRKLKEKNES